MGKKRICIFLLLILVLIIIVFEVISFNTIYLGSNTRIIVIGGKIIKKYGNKKIVLKKVNYYKNGEKNKGYIKSKEYENGNYYYIVSKDNKTIDLDNLIAAGLMIKLKTPSSSVINTNKEEIDIDELNDDLNLDLSIEDVNYYKNITYDIDNDKSKEEIIYVSYVMDNYLKISIFIRDDNGIINVFEYGKDRYSNEPQKAFMLSNIVDLNNDGNYEIIVSRVDKDSQPAYYDIYSYKNGKIKEIK